MYKALEAGYQMGLESLNENLSEIRAELVFAQRVLQFKPPLEELRASYYRDTKKFVSIPSAFEGFANGKVRSVVHPDFGKLCTSTLHFTKQSTTSRNGRVPFNSSDEKSTSSGTAIVDDVADLAMKLRP